MHIDTQIRIALTGVIASFVFAMATFQADMGLAFLVGVLLTASSWLGYVALLDERRLEIAEAMRRHPAGGNAYGVGRR